MALTFLDTAELPLCSDGWIGVAAIGAGVVVSAIGILLMHWSTYRQGKAMLEELQQLNTFVERLPEQEPKP